jgi:hypothetical protein
MDVGDGLENLLTGLELSTGAPGLFIRKRDLRAIMREIDANSAQEMKIHGLAND